MGTDLEYRTSPRHPGRWLWPREDRWAWKWLNKKEHFDLPRRIAALCQRRGLVIQAGGNCGLYPAQYSNLFQQVVTFEPDATNFHCLKINVPQSNVTMYQQALGDKSDLVALEPNQRWMESNRGALRTSGPGTIPQITIDSLDIAPDLVHLDIEGFEALALLGAQQTIARHHPLIALETNGSGDDYGWPQHKIDSLLKSWGYDVFVTWQHDTVYKHENH